MTSVVDVLLFGLPLFIMGLIFFIAGIVAVKQQDKRQDPNDTYVSAGHVEKIDYDVVSTSSKTRTHWYAYITYLDLNENLVSARCHIAHSNDYKPGDTIDIRVKKDDPNKVYRLATPKDRVSEFAMGFAGIGIWVLDTILVVQKLLQLGGS